MACARCRSLALALSFMLSAFTTYERSLALTQKHSLSCQFTPSPAHMNDNSNTSLEPFTLCCVAIRCDGNDASSSHLIPTQISAY